MKKLFALMLVLALAIISLNVVAVAEAPVLKIGVLDRTADEEAHIKFGEGIRAAAEEAGVECMYKCVGEEMTDIRSTLDTYVAQGCNVIVDFISSLEISQAIADDCERYGIFHICIDADPGEYSYFYGLSNGEAGAALGEYLVDYVANEMGNQCDLIIWASPIRRSTQSSASLMWAEQWRLNSLSPMNSLQPGVNFSMNTAKVFIMSHLLWTASTSACPRVRNSA